MKLCIACGDGLSIALHFRLTKYTVISALLLLIFLYTALSKIMPYNAFVAALKDVPLMGIHVSFVAWLIPAAELIIALLLFLPTTRLSGLFASFFSLPLFTGYLLYMIVFTSPCHVIAAMLSTALHGNSISC